jgi:hypothetical protein
VAFRFDYFRGERQVSSRGAQILSRRLAALAAVAALAPLPVWCQYPGQVTKSGKDAPELRAVAVLEWTGEADHPKASRIVPVCVYDNGELQDGGIYLARPQPLAVTSQVEYELQQNGKPVGLFDIKNAGQQQGSWVGYGAWKPLPIPKPKPSMDEVARSRIVDEESDLPVLHRKHHADEGKTAGNGGSGSASGGPPPASDPDRPTLHRKDSGDSSANAGSGSQGGGTNSGAGTASSPAPAPDSDKPTLHRRDSGDSAASSGGAPPSDPDRPVLKKSRKMPPEEIAHADSLPDFTDPDRPRLKRGKSAGDGLDLLPTLMGLPAEMRQAVAVSDAKSRPEHPWSFSWANPDDEAKMKSALEETARDALGLTPPPPPQPAPKKSARKNARPAPPVEPLPPAPLLDEQFRVFELAYGSGATLVLTARTDGPVNQRKFVTLIAQPDLYGNVLVLLKSVADGARLDETPRMNLIDAVDAMADNRAELLFELRGATQRQFVLYRVLRGQAEKLFVSSGGEFAGGGRE